MARIEISARVSGMDSEQLAAIRRDYRLSKLDRADLDPDPIAQFNRWLDEACRAEVIEPTAMSLSTVDTDARPRSRMVLLKGVDARGFVFFTNLGSRKAQQIEGNAHVALLFPWLALERQVIVTGKAEKVSVPEVLKYFVSRPRDSQVGAWASRQSRVLESKQILEMEWEKIKQKVAGGEVPLPSFWGGFRIKPQTIEFWQGRPSRLHDRFEYLRQPDDTWLIQQLYP